MWQFLKKKNLPVYNLSQIFHNKSWYGSDPYCIQQNNWPRIGIRIHMDPKQRRKHTHTVHKIRSIFVTIRYSRIMSSDPDPDSTPDLCLELCVKKVVKILSKMWWKIVFYFNIVKDYKSSSCEVYSPPARMSIFSPFSSAIPMRTRITDFLIL